MAKLKKPEDLGIKVPPKPFLQADVLEDEDDDEHYAEMSQAGLTSASEDLSVLDFFAAIVTIGLHGSGPVSRDPRGLAEQAYEMADALVSERARRENA